MNPQEGEATPSTPTNTNPIPELGIQDLIFMENRDRHYDPDVYVIRGIYTMQDLDFNLSQFGLFLQNDTLLIHFHLRGSVENLGRKIMAGDVLELPHLKDEYALDDKLVALKRFYVVQDVIRPSNGFSPTWYPHLIRAKCVPIVDSQEFKEILDADSGAEDGSTLRDLLSQYQYSIDLNDQIIKQATEDVKYSGFDTNQLYIVSTNRDEHNRFVNYVDSGSLDDDASIEQAILDASVILRSPSKDYYAGYLTGDGKPPNGLPFNAGTLFPKNPVVGQYHLRTDFLPNVLYRFDGAHWVKFEENVRMILNNFGHQDVVSGPYQGEPVRQTLKTSFINNINTSTINGEVIPERQALSKALRPRADN